MYKADENNFQDCTMDDTEISLFEPECIITDYSFPKTNNEVHSSWQIENKNQVQEMNKRTIQNNFVCKNEIMEIPKEYVENMQMHSIFMPDKRVKPKEVFTQCRSCEKHVIIRMIQETGNYSLCSRCFNDPFDTSVTMTKELVTSSTASTDNVVPDCSNHNGSRRFDGSFGCDQCGKVFTRNWYLKQHQKLHLNEKPFFCDHCDKRFLNSSNLKQHMRTHAIEYRCKMCNKTYISQSTLESHFLKHTSKTSNLEAHLDNKDTEKSNGSTSTPREVYQCPMCCKVFRYHAILIKHTKSHEST